MENLSVKYYELLILTFISFLLQAYIYMEMEKYIIGKFAYLKFVCFYNNKF